MKSVLLALFITLSSSALADENTCHCERYLKVKLYQSHYTLNLWHHAKDLMNATTIILPVSCDFSKT